MDGNRRWAKAHMFKTFFGHQEGFKRIEEVVEYCYNENIEYCSFWALAKKNIENRSKEELDYLYDLIFDSIASLSARLIEKGIRFEWVGNPDILPPRIVELRSKTRELSKNGDKMTLIITIGYG